MQLATCSLWSFSLFFWAFFSLLLLSPPPSSNCLVMFLCLVPIPSLAADWWMFSTFMRHPTVVVPISFDRWVRCKEYHNDFFNLMFEIRSRFFIYFFFKISYTHTHTHKRRKLKGTWYFRPYRLSIFSLMKQEVVLGVCWPPTFSIFLIGSDIYSFSCLIFSLFVSRSWNNLPFGKRVFFCFSISLRTIAFVWVCLLVELVFRKPASHFRHLYDGRSLAYRLWQSWLACRLLPSTSTHPEFPEKKKFF